MKTEGGLRCRGRGKESRPGKPLVSVITVVLNDSERLDETIKNVICQSYDNIEYLIIDGGSNDRTLDVIREREGAIDYYLSEPDSGIYDGMNKAVSLASGEWIIFMNSGDILYSRDTIEKVMNGPISSADLVFGDWVGRYPQYGDLRAYKTAGNLDDLWKGMVFSHQALFTRRGILKKRGFDCGGYKYGADYDFILWAYHEGYRFRRIDEVIAEVSSGGEVDRNIVEAKREHMKICLKYRKCRFYCLYYHLLILKTILAERMKTLIPRRLLRCMYRARYSFPGQRTVKS